MQNDMALLERYSRTGDAEAFAELAKRYARLVYGTCLRITANMQEAEDITQECFLELARRAGTVRSCLPAWLHKVARNRALNAVSKNAVRRRYEQAAFGVDDSRFEPEWADIVPIVDEALGKLPDKLREPIVLHYLQGLTQAEAAAALGINQSTISRNLDRAIGCLREELKRAGVVLTVGALAVLLTESAKASVPGSVVAAMGKIAVSGIGNGAGVGAATGATGGFTSAAMAILGTGLGKAALVIGILVVSLAAGMTIHASRASGPAAGEVVSGGSAVDKRDPAVLQFYLLQDVVYSSNPKAGGWTVSAPQRAGDGYVFERTEYDGRGEAHVVETLSSATQPAEVMDQIVHPAQNAPFLTVGDMLPNAEAAQGKDGKVVVLVKFTAHGADASYDFCRKHDAVIGVFANGKLVTAPISPGTRAVRCEMIEISGWSSLAEAEAVAKQINGIEAAKP